MLTDKSLDCLKTCHPDIVRLFVMVEKDFPLTVLGGYYNGQGHEGYLQEGGWPFWYGCAERLKHPSTAVLVAPRYHWSGTELRYYFILHGVVTVHANQQNLEFEWSGLKLGKRDNTDKMMTKLCLYKLINPIST